jgi:CRISPR/Cas system endoribonuclease Cas6 (RAMP superfamily)
LHQTPSGGDAALEANVLVSDVRDLKTTFLKCERFVQKGFVGEVVYELKSEDTEMTRCANTLADFALCAGMGYKTTWGRGRCLRVVG